MDLVHIFDAGRSSGQWEGLWAVRYEPNEKHSFRKFFDWMEDAEGVYDFCVNNLEDVQMKFGYPISAEEAALELMQEARELKELVVGLAKKKWPEKNLQYLFQPLDNRESNLQELQLSKGSMKRNRFIPKLRIYGIRIDAVTFVITGGAIKLTHKMDERLHTKEEEVKMRKVKNWLQYQGIYFPDDLTQ